MGLTFDQPSWLWLLVLAVPTALGGVAWFSSMSRVRKWAAVGARVIVIALLAAMLAGASSVRKLDRMAVIGVVDVSESVRLFGSGTERESDPIKAARQFLLSQQQRRGPDDLLGVVAFDGRATVVAMPTRGDLAERTFEFRSVDGTDLAGAIQHAAAIIPAECAGRLILFSDGVQTSGDAAVAAREVSRGADSGIPIDVVPIELRSTREVMLESVDAPPRSVAGATITVRVSLRATGPARGELRLSREGEPVDLNGAEAGVGRRVELTEGRHVEVVTVPLPPGRLHRFDAIFVPESEVDAAGNSRAVGDSRAENNRASAMTVTSGRGSVLLVDGVNVPGGPGGGGVLARTLREADIDVTVIPPEGIPEGILALQAFDMVVMENVPADSVSAAAQKALASFVKDTGGGMMMVGGPDALGAGGWKGSTIEPLLPVRLDLPEKLVQPDAAVVLVLDNSGSMNRDVLGSVYTQQQIANQAAALAVRTLDSKDLVGVIVFNTNTTVVVPLHQNTDPKATASRILGIGSDGGTVMGPALTEAAAQISQVKAAVKHIIVLSDGRSSGFQDLPKQAEKIHMETGATISTISVGNLSDEQTMAEIASRGGGKCYIVSNPNLLPKFFLKAIRVVRAPMIRQGRFPVAMEPVPSPLTAGIETPPPLLGYVLTQRRPEPTITYAMSVPGIEPGERFPLLAHWGVELGQVGVFTSDASAWAREWVPWGGYRRVWTQVVRSMSRAAQDSPYELSVDSDGDGLKVRLDAVSAEGKPVEGLTVPIVVHSPSGVQETMTLSQTGPGTYEGRMRAREAGAHIVIAKPTMAGKAVAGIIGGASVSSGVEFRRLATDHAALEDIARTSGGRVLGFDDGARINLFDRSGVKVREMRSPLWRVLLLWTLVAFMVDVGMRRIAWDRFVSREFGVDLRKAAAESVQDRSRQAARSVGTLRRTEAPVRVETRALTDADADAVAEAEQERRRAAQLARLQAIRERNQGGEDGGEGEASSAVPEPSVPKEETSGLAAAKRRARERMENREGDA